MGWYEDAVEVVQTRQHKRGLDLQTANAMLQVYQSLSPAHQAAYRAWPVDKAATFAWRMVS